MTSRLWFYAALVSVGVVVLALTGSVSRSVRTAEDLGLAVAALTLVLLVP